MNKILTFALIITGLETLSMLIFFFLLTYSENIYGIEGTGFLVMYPAVGISLIILTILRKRGVRYENS